MTVSEGAPPAEPEPRWGKPAWVAQRYGLPRYRVFELIKEGHFRSALIKRKGRKKGLRLIDLSSVDRYLEQHLTSPEASSGDCSQCESCKSTRETSAIPSRKTEEANRRPERRISKEEGR
jgi:hypothetical protein